MDTWGRGGWYHAQRTRKQIQAGPQEAARQAIDLHPAVEGCAATCRAADEDRREKGSVRQLPRRRGHSAVPRP